MSDSEMDCSFDPAALLELGIEDNGPGDILVDDQEMTDDGMYDNVKGPLAIEGKPKLKSFEDEEQYFPLMELKNNVQADEMDQRSKYFDLTKVDANHILSRAYTHCTMCDVHIQFVINQKPLFGHPILKTLVCETCYKFYGDGNFDRGEDGVDLYCRFCAEGGTLYICSKCPNAFCEKCIKRNFGSQEVKKVKDTDSWYCYICEPRLLWGHRGSFATLQSLQETLKKNPNLPTEEKTCDQSHCCEWGGPDKKTVFRNKKMFVQFCPGVVLPVTKAIYPNKKLSLFKTCPPAQMSNSAVAVSNANIIEEPVSNESMVNDFFTNGHFLEAALPKGQHSQKSGLQNNLIIRPKLLSSLQSSPINACRNITLFPRASSYLVRGSIPLNAPNVNRMNIRNNSLNISHVARPIILNHTRQQFSPQVTNQRSVLPKPTTTSSPKIVTAPAIAKSTKKPTLEWFGNIIDQAVLSADYYKEEIMKLKIASMNLALDKNIKVNSDPRVAHTLQQLKWAMRSVLDQTVDIRKSIVSHYPNLPDSVAQPLNMNRLQKAKGPTQSSKPALPSRSFNESNNQLKNNVANKRPSLSITAKPASANTVASTKVTALNGKTKIPNGEVVDLVSDDEDTPNQPVTQMSLYKKRGVGRPIKNSTPIASPNSSVLFSPVNNPHSALALPSTNVQISPRTKKKKLDSDDEDYVPGGTPGKRKRYRSGSRTMNLSGSNTNMPKLLVTNVRSLQQDPKKRNSVSNTSSGSSYPNNLLAKVLKPNDDSDTESGSSDIDSADISSEKDQDDDWISRNPTKYEQYCKEYNLIRNLHIKVQRLSDNR